MDFHNQQIYMVPEQRFENMMFSLDYQIVKIRWDLNA